MTRANFFTTALGSIATLAAVRLGQSSSGVPRKLDCRLHRDECATPVDIYRHGIKQRGVVAYDLEAQTIVRYKETPSGQLYVEGDDFASETLHGGIVVRWSKDA